MGEEEGTRNDGGLSTDFTDYMDWGYRKKKAEEQEAEQKSHPQISSAEG